MLDSVYTNGVIAVKEKQLLGDKLLRFIEMTADEALRSLKESGFGVSSEDGEEMCRAEESALDAFIREYAPSDCELIYLLAPRDFHNAKAICKAERLKTDAEKLLTFEGLIKLSELIAAIRNADFKFLGEELGGAVKEVLEREDITGAEIGAVFDRALFAHLSKSCAKNRVLKKLIARRADCTNILTAMRSGDREFAGKLYLKGGSLKTEALDRIFDENAERAARAMDGTPYAGFYRLCLDAKEKGQPFTEAERALESSEAEYFAEKRFELEGKQPFLYYVFRRRA